MTKTNNNDYKNNINISESVNINSFDNEIKIENVQSREQLSFSVFDDFNFSSNNKNNINNNNVNINNINNNNGNNNNNENNINNNIKVKIDIDINDIESYIPTRKNEYIIECSICLDKFDMLDSINAFLDCNCIIHSVCFHEYVKNEVDLKNIPILCPNHTCKKEVNPNFITKCLEFDKKVLQKFENFSLSHPLYGEKSQ